MCSRGRGCHGRRAVASCITATIVKVQFCSSYCPRSCQPARGGRGRWGWVSPAGIRRRRGDTGERNRRRCSPAWTAPHHPAVALHSSAGPTSLAKKTLRDAPAPARRCHRSADGSHPGMNFMPLAIFNNYLTRETSDQ